MSLSTETAVNSEVFWMNEETGKRVNEEAEKAEDAAVKAEEGGETGLDRDTAEHTTDMEATMWYRRPLWGMWILSSIAMMVYPNIVY